jgi:hypothetical protein
MSEALEWNDLAHTQWFPADVAPARKGIYERDLPQGRRFAHWDGEKWCGWSTTVEGAASNADMISSNQSAPWRGLTREWKQVVVWL